MSWNKVKRQTIVQNTISIMQWKGHLKHFSVAYLSTLQTEKLSQSCMLCKAYSLMLVCKMLYSSILSANNSSDMIKCDRNS